MCIYILNSVLQFIINKAHVFWVDFAVYII